MSFQCLGAAFVDDIPNADRFVVAGGEDVFASRVPDNTADPVIMTNQGEEADADTHVPDFDRLVPVVIRRPGKGPALADPPVVLLLSPPVASTTDVNADSGAHAMHSTVWS